MLKPLLLHFVYAVSSASFLGLISGHRDWAEQILNGFSWGHAFFEVNGGLLERYAQCADAEEIGNVQEAWLTRLEREWVESRVDKGGEDEWAGGNPNRRDDIADEDGEEGKSEADEDEDDEAVGDYDGERGQDAVAGTTSH